jgi:glycosyltransferase involved in cell wall biosynthesis
LESFLESYFQVLRHLIPDIRISIVGKGAGANLKRLASLYPDNIFLHGFVKDIDEILLRCCAMISPLTFGSGVKLKALDSLRCGTPLISTLCGVEGIETGSSRGVLKGEVQAFPAMMLQMLNPERNAAASRANAELYRHFYSLGAVDQVYHQLLLNTQNFTTTPVPVPVAS